MSKNVISDILTRIRNAIRLKSCTVEVIRTRTTQILSEILLKESLICEIMMSNSLSAKTPKLPLLLIRLKYRGFLRIPIITNLKCISRPCLRIYRSSQYIPPILCGFGSAIISTSEGFILDREARARRIGGEIICSIWLFKFYNYACKILGKENL